MVLKFFKKNIISKALSWHFIDAPRNIKQAFSNFLRFGWHFFSISFHFKTLFSHWRHYKDTYGKGFNPKRYFETFVGNTFSRTLGATVRLSTIGLGLASEALILVAAIAGLLLWYFLPLILAAGFVWGLRLLI